MFILYRITNRKKTEWPNIKVKGPRRELLLSDQRQPIQCQIRAENKMPRMCQL